MRTHLPQPRLTLRNHRYEGLPLYRIGSKRYRQNFLPWKETSLTLRTLYWPMNRIPALIRESSYVVLSMSEGV